jgi:hypothetical protein
MAPLDRSPPVVFIVLRMARWSTKKEVTDDASEQQ